MPSSTRSPPRRGGRASTRSSTRASARNSSRRTGAGFTAVRPGGYEPEEHLRDSEADGVMGSVLYPTEGLLLYTVADGPLLSAACRAYNDWLAEFCAAAPSRLKGVAMLNVDDV